MNNHSERQRGILALIGLAATFASMGLFARYLSIDFALFQQIYLRVLAAFIFSVVFFFKDIHVFKIKRIPTREWGLLFLRAVSTYVIGVTLFTQAIIIAKYSNVSFIGALPMSAILGVLLFKETLNWKRTSFILSAFFGVLLIAINDYSQLFIWGRGEMLMLIATFFFSLSYVSRKWHSSLLNNQEITILLFVLAFLVLFGISVIKGDGLPIVNWHAGLFFVILIAGFFNVLNMFLTNYGFHHIEAVVASNILTLESVFAVLLGFFFYQEIPTLKELLGGTIIVASVIGMNSIKK